MSAGTAGTFSARSSRQVLSAFARNRCNPSGAGYTTSSKNRLAETWERNCIVGTAARASPQAIKLIEELRMGDQSRPGLKATLNLGVQRYWDSVMKSSRVNGRVHSLFETLSCHEQRPVPYPGQQGCLEMCSKSRLLAGIGWILGLEAWFEFVRVREKTFQTVPFSHNTELGQGRSLGRDNVWFPLIPIHQAEQVVGIAALIAEPLQGRKDRTFALDSFDDHFGCKEVRSGEFLQPGLIDALVVRPFDEKDALSGPSTNAFCTCGTGLGGVLTCYFLF